MPSGDLASKLLVTVAPEIIGNSLSLGNPANRFSGLISVILLTGVAAGEAEISSDFGVPIRNK